MMGKPLNALRVEENASVLAVGPPFFGPQEIKTDYPLGQPSQCSSFRPLGQLPNT